MKNLPFIAGLTTGLLTPFLAIAIFLFFSLKQTTNFIDTQNLTVFQTPNFSKNLQSLNHKNDGNFSLINFWATWCVPCIAEMPLLDSLSVELQPYGITTYVLSDEPFEKINAFKQKKSFPNLFITSFDSPKNYSKVLPTTYLINNSNGKVLWSKKGKIEGSLEDITLEILNSTRDK